MIKHENPIRSNNEEDKFLEKCLKAMEIVLALLELQGNMKNENLPLKLGKDWKQAEEVKGDDLVMKDYLYFRNSILEGKGEDEKADEFVAKSLRISQN